MKAIRISTFTIIFITIVIGSLFSIASADDDIWNQHCHVWPPQGMYYLYNLFHNLQNKYKIPRDNTTVNILTILTHYTDIMIISYLY